MPSSSARIIPGPALASEHAAQRAPPAVRWVPGRRHSPDVVPTRRRLQIALGLLWLLDAVLECQPEMFHAGFFGDTFLMNMFAPPAWLWDLITKVGPAVTAHPAVANAVAVAVQFSIGLGLLCGPARCGPHLRCPFPGRSSSGCSAKRRAGFSCKVRALLPQRPEPRSSTPSSPFCCGLAGETMALHRLTEVPYRHLYRSSHGWRYGWGRPRWKPST